MIGIQSMNAEQARRLAEAAAARIRAEDQVLGLERIADVSQIHGVRETLISVLGERQPQRLTALGVYLAGLGYTAQVMPWDEIAGHVLKVSW